jgi:hypothetical protein
MDKYLNHRGFDEKLSDVGHGAGHESSTSDPQRHERTTVMVAGRRDSRHLLSHHAPLETALPAA